MHKTHTKLDVWFLAIYLIGHDKRGISAKKLMQDIDVSYPTAWLMLHKIRKAMGDRDAFTILGTIPPVLGSNNVAALLTSGAEEVIGAVFVVEENPITAAELAIKQIEKKRAALGLNP